MARTSTKYTIDNHKFDSIPEARFYCLCKHAKENGWIRDFEIQVRYEIIPEFIDFKEGKSRPTNHDIDFKLYLNEPHLGSDFILVDTKDSGDYAEKESVLKRKLWMSQHENIPYYFICQVDDLYLGAEYTEQSINKKSQKWKSLSDDDKEFYRISIFSPWVEMSSGSKLLNKIKAKHLKIHGKQDSKNKTKWTPEKEWEYFFELDNVANMFYTFEGNIPIKRAYKTAVEGGLNKIKYSSKK